MFIVGKFDGANLLLAIQSLGKNLKGILMWGIFFCFLKYFIHQRFSHD